MSKYQKLPFPPPWADKLLQWLCPDELLEEVQGDLQELFEERIAEQDGICTGSVGLLTAFWIQKKSKPLL